MKRSTLVVLVLCAASVSLAKDFETPPKLKASEVLAPDVVAGESYRVREEVTNNGYMNSFVIESDFGEFAALSEWTLHKRIREINALTRLDGLSKSQVFVQAVGEGAIRSLRGFKTIVENPVETAKGVPEGVGRFFKRTKHNAKEGYAQAKDMVKDEDDEPPEATQTEEAEAEESRTDQARDMSTAYAMKYFGVNTAQRRWAQKLEVDPYTSNEVLRKAIAEVAKVDAAGRFTAALAPIPRVPGAKYANTVTSLVWSREPWELVEENTKALVDAGATKEMTGAFFDNVYFNPTLQTAFVHALLDLRPAENLQLALAQAAEAESEAEATLFVHGAAMLRWFHHKQSPVVALLDGGDRAFIARAGDGRLVIPLPIDALFWTRETAEAADFATSLAESFDTREMWVAGQVSDRARQGLADLGWGVETEVAARIKANPVEPPGDGDGDGDG